MLNAKVRENYVAVFNYSYGAYQHYSKITYSSDPVKER